jgi:hypothetical protein
LPKHLDFGPPELTIIDALVNGSSPAQHALDRHSRAAAAA